MENYVRKDGDTIHPIYFLFIENTQKDETDTENKQQVVQVLLRVTVDCFVIIGNWDTVDWFLNNDFF